MVTNKNYIWDIFCLKSTETSEVEIPEILTGNRVRREFWTPDILVDMYLNVLKRQCNPEKR